MALSTEVTAGIILGTALLTALAWYKFRIYKLEFNRRKLEEKYYDD